MKKVIQSLFLFSCLTIQLQLIAQIANQEIIHNDTKVSLLAQNLNSQSSSSISLRNNMGKSFDLSINGSAPLFGLTANESIISTSAAEGILVRTDGSTRARIDDSGLALHNGGHLITISPNDNERFGISTQDDGAMYFLQNNVLFSPIMYLDDDQIRVGIGTIQPNTELAIKQSVSPILGAFGTGVVDIAGLTIESLTGDRLTQFVHTDQDLVFAFNGIYRSYINDQNGSYNSVSDRRFKQNISSLSSVLDKVLQLNPSSYQFKGYENPENSIGFIAQEVQEIFPELVHDKDGSLALSYADFSVLAIKAIQEQQEIISGLQAKNSQLENDQVLIENRLKSLESILTNSALVSKTNE